MAASVTVSAPLHVQEVIDFLHFCLRSGLVVGVPSLVPARPNRWRVNVDDVFTKIATADRGLAQGIECVRQGIQLDHKRANFVLIKLFEIAGPVVLISDSPDDHGRMIAMLVDQVAQHTPRLLLVTLAAQSAATPGNLFPHQQTQLIAHIEDHARLLVMPETNEVCAHVFYQTHLASHEILSHCGCETGMIFVTLRAANQQALAVQFEWTTLYEFKRAQAETLGDLRRAVNTLQRHHTA